MTEPRPCPTCGHPPTQKTGWPVYFVHSVYCARCYEPGSPIGYSIHTRDDAIVSWNFLVEDFACDGCGTRLDDVTVWDVNAYYDTGADDVEMCDWCLFGSPGTEIGGEG